MGQEALNMAERLGHVSLEGHSLVLIAQALVRQGRAAQALPYARRAVDVFVRADMREQREQAEELVRECEGKV